MQYLQKAAAQAVLLITNAAVVQVSPHHANDGSSLLVADCIEEGLNTPDTVNTFVANDMHIDRQNC